MRKLAIEMLLEDVEDLEKALTANAAAVSRVLRIARALLDPALDSAPKAAPKAEPKAKAKAEPKAKRKYKKRAAKAPSPSPVVQPIYFELPE
jgi:hypothetical protein